MKKLLIVIAAIFITSTVLSQTPQKMSYQAVIRNASNALITNAPVKMKISILQGSTQGISVYSELHSATTNANGLVSIEIGGGTSPTGTFSSINWGNGTYFLKTETDPTNGTNYTISGTSQLLSVPYALESKIADSARNTNHKWSKNGDIVEDQQFIGTLNNKPLLFKINNQHAGLIGVDEIQNVAFGYQTLSPNSTGVGNVGIGWKSLTNNQKGSVNIAIGNNTLENIQNTTSNVAIGHHTLRNLNIDGVSYNTAVGEGALINLKTGTYNTAYGVYSLGSLIGGGANIGIGTFTGMTVTSGERNIFIGNHSDATDPGVFNSTAIGFGAKVSASNSIVLGGTGEYASNVGIGTPSPARKLHVNAVMRLEPISEAPPNPSKGDMYFDSVINKLRVYDGTSWQNCW